MHYFAHTLKGCGSVALALVLTACGEETTGISAASSSQNLEGTEALSQDIESFDRQTLAQRTVVAQVSSLGIGARNSRALIAPVRGNLEKTDLARSGSIITAPGQNTRPGQGAITRPTPDPEYRDELPELPPIDFADGSEESGSNPVIPPQDASLDLPPVIGADPLVTLIAKTDSDLNSSGTRLVWSAENVDSCTASGAWEGDIAANGQLDLQHDKTGDLTYMIMCNGASGTAMAMVTITVESTALAWDAPVQNTNGTQLTDLAGYNLYYGTETGRYTQVRPVRDASQTNLELPVEPGTYYLAMTAYDLSGNESDLSNEIIRTVY